MAIAILVGSDEQIRSNRGRLALTSTQAAARLEVSERTLRRYVEAGKITPHEEKCGTLSIFTLDDVEQLRSNLRETARQRREDF